VPKTVEITCEQCRRSLVSPSPVRPIILPIRERELFFCEASDLKCITVFLNENRRRLSEELWP